MNFEEQVDRVGYAYINAQCHYDEYPPKDDIVSIVAAINGWTFISGCYMGIEQTMKLLIRMRGGTDKKTHDLDKLYSLLDVSQRNVVAAYYRVYRSLHNFDSGNIPLATVDEFIEHIGKGYTKWRYILIEDPVGLPKIHLGAMLEIWNALACLAEGVSGPYHQTVNKFLEGYIDGVVRHAEMDDEWQVVSQNEFSEIRKWVKCKEGSLKAGIYLFHHLYHRVPMMDLKEISPLMSLMSKVLLRAANMAAHDLDLTTHSQHRQGLRRADIAMFHHRIQHGGLTWNIDKQEFEPTSLLGTRNQDLR